ncbi:MAG: hypothetical protein LC776_19640 [Acidobacteria bacterium]|nr:hypothetical protein [Acidobacteriota bacterium]
MAIGTKHAPRFPMRADLVGVKHHAELADDEVEALVVEWQILCVRRLKGRRSAYSALTNATPPVPEPDPLAQNDICEGLPHVSGDFLMSSCHASAPGHLVKLHWRVEADDSADGTYSSIRG